MTYWLLAILATLFLAGCASSSSASDSADSSLSADHTTSARASLRPATTQPTRIGRDGSDELTGTLGADSVEGGCPYLEAEDGRHYEVIYPDGWSVRAAPLQLTSPDGEVVATGGETITVRGSEAGDMASICMIGPIFNADEVVSIE